MRNTVCLNGYWDFLPIFDDDLTFEDALAKGVWIRDRYLVPSSWRSMREMYNIFNYPSEWDKARRGALRRRIHVTRREGERVFLRLDAVGQSCRVLLNGQEIAETDDMFLPLETELNPFLAPGETEAEITVLCGEIPTVTRPDGAVKNLAPAGTWYAGITRGIWQDAWLVTRPEVYLRDPFLLTRWEEKTITATVETDGGTGEVTAEILNAEGQCVLALDASLTASWPDVHPWMPDDPCLYTCRFTLRRNGEVVDVLDQRFGFREFTTVGPDLFLNGVKLHLRGDAWHYQGLAMQRKSYAENWIAMAKEIGVNFIRPHGFPYPQCFYDAADENGMLILAESGIYGSGKSMQADDPRFLDSCRRHLRHFVRDYRNHPSVFLWSMQNEMRWVDGREGYKDAIPGLMAVVQAEDPSRRLVSCDGDNRLLTDEMMQAVSMHYNIDGRISDWNRKKPLVFGEHGAFHYLAPQGTAAYGGAGVYESFWEAMDAVAKRERDFLRVARREGVTGVTPFNYVNYMNKAMPFADRPVDPGDVTAPGPHPSVIRAFSLPVNNGQMSDLPRYLPQPALRTVSPETAQIALLPDECNEVFFAGDTVTRHFHLYNDTCRAHGVTVRCVAELRNGRTVLAREESFSQDPGDARLLTYEIPVRCSSPTELTVRFTVFHDDARVLERAFVYGVKTRDETPVTDKTVVYFGPGALPGWIGPNVTSISDLDALSDVQVDLLVLGEDLPYDQHTLQPVLQTLTDEGRVGGILILAQTAFAPGDLKLSRRPFFAAWSTGEHPVTAGLLPRDLGFWGPENPEDTDTEGGWMIQNAYDKPDAPGWRVLLECSQGDWGWGGTNWCAMLLGMVSGIPVLLTQIRLTDFLDKAPAARILLRRSVEYLTRPVPVSGKVLCSGGMPDPAEAEAVLKAGGTVIVTDVTREDLPALSRLLRREVTITEAPAYQVSALPHPLTRNLTAPELTGLEHTTYSTAAQKNTLVARFALETSGVSPLLVTTPAPWTEMFTEDGQAEPIKIYTATRFSQTAHEQHCYGFASPARGGQAVVTTLLAKESPRLARAAALMAMNAGARFDTGLFRLEKAPLQHSISEYMWLRVEPFWDYEEAVAYHADPLFLLNNLGEGSYGWMQRVSASDGCAVLRDAGPCGAFVTVFADCALNHDPEKRDPGEIPDPSIVPDLTVTCNTAFDVYVNGRKHPGLADTPDGPVDVVLEDVLLEKGVNRIFFRLSPRDGDLILGAVFRDKLGDYLTDATWRLTLD